MAESLADLELRESDRINFFYDRKRKNGRTIVDQFILVDRPQIAVMCKVTLVRKDEGCSPRLRFWVKDKLTFQQTTIELPNTPEVVGVKAAVDTKDAHEGFWRLIHFLQGVRGVVVPQGSFSLVAQDKAELAERLSMEDKHEVLEAVRTAIGGSLTEQDISLIANRKQELREFRRLLEEPEYFRSHRAYTGERPEAVWQNFFERNQWIFGYGLNLIPTDGLDDGKLERATSGNNFYTGAGNRIDALMRSRGYVSTLLFCEIKRHDSDLVAPKAYRKPSIYAPSYELAGAIAQVQKTTRKAIRQISTQMAQNVKPDGTPTGIWYNTSRPRQVVVIGMLQKFDSGAGANGEMMENFELFRTSLTDTEVITYDELYERARFIVES